MADLLLLVLALLGGITYPNIAFLLVVTSITDLVDRIPGKQHVNLSKREFNWTRDTIANANEQLSTPLFLGRADKMDRELQLDDPEVQETTKPEREKRRKESEED